MVSSPPNYHKAGREQKSKSFQHSSAFSSNLSTAVQIRTFEALPEVCGFYPTFSQKQIEILPKLPVSQVLEFHITQILSVSPGNRINLLATRIMFGDN